MSGLAIKVNDDQILSDQYHRRKKDNKVKMDSLNKKNRKKKMLCFKNRDDFNFLRQKQKYQKRCKG